MHNSSSLGRGTSVTSGVPQASLGRRGRKKFLERPPINPHLFLCLYRIGMTAVKSAATRGCQSEGSAGGRKAERERWGGDTHRRSSVLLRPVAMGTPAVRHKAAQIPASSRCRDLSQAVRWMAVFAQHVCCYPAPSQNPESVPAHSASKITTALPNGPVLHKRTAHSQ